ncbi:D-alanyl-D-alanine carboxypeptidase [Geosporobacter subterraneus DSM 17957]|uniref:D-alanyl-D-alanine carboxypeptidase n=1 Tax=Geosporobacter subterraneus DSM 17957 TaxID=1121919 RepID=A0A1M6INA3_9FIRM|nr:M15 family metallopeptidase [Geosporobacter subterraneus]SHJ35833.1 D-alanyl-D-alanine carboxypeptidase [Geosporobacter subterraneus DSM 17957]
MKKFGLWLIILALTIGFGRVNRNYIRNQLILTQEENEYTVTMKRDLLCLMMAYPGHITGIEAEDGKGVFIVMRSGRRILYDDKKEKSFQEKLSSPDLQDMLEQIYPLEDIQSLMPPNFDPGRIRVYSFLHEVYGGSKAQVEGNLTNVKAGPQYILFNKQNGAAEALDMVMDELVPLAGSNPKIYPFVFPMSGTFNYRNIAGTGQLSPHAFGTAIDLARNNKDYWKWATREEGEKRLAVYPREIVKIFEKNRFVWGGKWTHFDILHFEYRPELILKARYFSGQAKPHQLWYEGLTSMDDTTRSYIQMIESALD